jgi:hypothetical protein
MENSKQNNDRRSLDLNKIAVWVALASIFSVLILGGRYFSSIAVKLNNVDVIDARLDKKIQILNQLHGDIDNLEIRVKDGDHALELKIKDETIARKDLEIEFYKNK